MGRRIWVLDTYAGQQICVGPLRVETFKQFLPAGEFGRRNFIGDMEVGVRKRSLVQLWTDGGMRTVAVASIWSKDPGKSASPW